MLRKVSAAYAGGLVGALVDSFDIWLLGKAGVTALLGIGLRPEWTAPWLYPRLVWGGIWVSRIRVISQPRPCRVQGNSPPPGSAELVSS